MRETIEEIIENPRLRAELIARGKIRSDLFSWEKTAQKTKELYNQVLALS